MAGSLFIYSCTQSPLQGLCCRIGAILLGSIRFVRPCFRGFIIKAVAVLASLLCQILRIVRTVQGHIVRRLGAVKQIDAYAGGNLHALAIVLNILVQF